MTQSQEARISKGGDSQTTTTSGDLPSWYKGYATDLLSKAKTVAETPYQTYGNQRLADFSGDTNNAFDLIRNQAQGGTPGIDAAVTTAGNTANYTANTIPNMDVSAYMNPYTQNVLDVQKARATQTFNEQQAGRNAAAVQAGAFGGDRRFVQDSLATRDLNQQLQEMDATGLSAAYDRATGLFQQDESNRRAAAQLGLDAATQQGALSQTQQDMRLKNAEALSGVGSKVQQRQQAGLDLAYQDFQNQRDYPSQQLSLYSQLLYGAPVQQNTKTTTSTPAPDFLSQLLGLAVGGAGIADLFT